MHTKNQKVCTVMGVVLGVGCFFSVQASGQADDPKNQTKKKSVSSLSQSKRQSCSTRSKVSLPKTSTAFAAETAFLPPSVDGVKKNEQILQQNNLEVLDNALKEPGRKVALDKLLEYTIKVVADGFEVNLDRVNKIFGLNTELGHIENEAGTKFYSSKEELLAAGVAQANKDQKLREADIFSLRRWMLKQEQDKKMPTNIDELLERQRADRSLVFFYVASENLKQLNSADNQSNEVLVKLQKTVKGNIEIALKKIEEEDRKFDKNQVFNDVLRIARKSKNNSEIVVHFSALVKPDEGPSVQEEETKKTKSWLSF